MSTARLPINHWDTGKVSRDKINDSFNEVVNIVAWYRPHIESWYWWIWDTNTWVKAQWDSIDMKVEDWYIWYKSESANWTQIIAIEDLKWDKWDTGATFVSAEFVGNDLVFTKDDGTTVVVEDAKVDLKWDTWASITSAAFDNNDIVFGKDDGTDVTLQDAKTELKWDQWDPWNGIASITSNKVWKVTTVTVTETDGDSESFQIQDWADGQWAWDVIWPAWATDGHLVVFDGTTGKIVKDWWAIPQTTIIDDLNSTSTTAALSANQGRVLNGRISTVEARGRFLSNWDATTWMPVSFPEDLPYTFKTWDYFDVTVVGVSNKRPSGSSYSGAASTTAETDALALWDSYVYDGSIWLLQLNHNITTTFATISGQPTDNLNLAAALSDKQDELVSGTNIKTINNQSILWNGNINIDSSTVKQFAYPSVSDDITALHNWLFQWNTPTRKWAILTSGGGNYTDYYVVVYCMRDTFADEGEIYAEKTTSAGTTYVKIDYSMPDTTATVDSITTSTSSWLPTWWTNRQILMMVNWTPTWVTPADNWFVMDAGWPITIKYIWAWDKDAYDWLASYNSNTHYDVQ